MKIVKGKFDPIPASYSVQLKNMTELLLCRDAKKRPSLNEILKMPIIMEKMKALGYISEPSTTPGGEEALKTDSKRSGGSNSAKPIPPVKTDNVEKKPS